MKDIWEDFDPSFYQALNSSDMVMKFYLIGSTLPDMFDFQDAIKDFMGKVYEWRDLISLNHPMNISYTTYTQVQEEMIPDIPLNQNIDKVREMVEYARSHNFSPLKKALIYGCYAHLLEDIVAHMILQPGVFGYGKNVEPEAMFELAEYLEQDPGNVFIEIAEPVYELFTPTHIPDWSFIHDYLYYGELKRVELEIYGGDTVRNFVKVYKYNSRFEFYDFTLDKEVWIDNQHFEYGHYTKWEDTNFVAVQGFVEAANGVGYNIENLTQERLEAYILGFGMALYFSYPIIKNPQWGLSDIKNYFYSVVFDTISIDEKDVLFKLSTALFSKIMRSKTFMFALPICGPVGTGEIGTKVLLSLTIPVWALLTDPNLVSVPWPEFLEHPENIVSYIPKVEAYIHMLEILRLADIDDTVERYTYIIEKYKEAIDTLNQVASVKRPNLRSTYADQLTEALKFKGFIKGILNREDYVWYRMGERNVFAISRKAGVLGGLWDVDANYTFYYQPSVFQMDFYQEGEIAYHGFKPDSAMLYYDMIPLGVTKVEVRAKKTEIDSVIVREIIDTLKAYTHLRDSLPFNVQDAAMAGFTSINWTVKTQAKGFSDKFNTMLSSAYGAKYFEEPAFYNNRYYQMYLDSGNVYRCLSKSPVESPLRYWPYSNLIKRPELTHMRILSDSPLIMELGWRDVASPGDRYRIYRNGDLIREFDGDVTAFVDSAGRPMCEVSYYVSLVRDNVEVCSSRERSLLTDITPPVVDITYPLNWQVVESESGYVDIQWNAFDNCGIVKQVVYIGGDSISLSPDDRSYRMTLPLGSRYYFKGIVIKAKDRVSEYGIDNTNFIACNPDSATLEFASYQRPDGSIILRVEEQGKDIPGADEDYYVVMSYPSMGEPLEWEKWEMKPFYVVGSYAYFNAPLKLSRPGFRSYVWIGKRGDATKFTKLNRVYSFLSVKGSYPELYVYTDTGYVYENSLIPGFVEGDFCRDYYKLMVKPERIGNRYRLKIKNPTREDIRIEMVKLRGIDHSRDVEVFVTFDGRIITGEEINGYSVYDTLGNDITYLISERDGSYIEGDSGSIFMGEVSDDSGQIVLCYAEGENGMDILVPDSTDFTKAGFILSRKNGAYSACEVGNGRELYYRFNGKGKVDLLKYYRKVKKDYYSRVLPLNKAISGGEDVKRLIKKEDGWYYELCGGDSIILEFRGTGVNPHLVRDFVFEISIPVEDGLSEATSKGVSLHKLDDGDGLKVEVKGGIIRIHGEGKVKVVDISGRQVWSGEIEVMKEIDGLKGGVYFVVKGRYVRKVCLIR